MTLHISSACALNDIVSFVLLLPTTELETWSVSQLNEFLSELEWRVQHHSETLIAELALRDELEFEKELKNTFISLLLNVQNKRRHVATNQKKPPAASTAKNGNKTVPGSYNSESKVRPSPFFTLFFFLTIPWLLGLCLLVVLPSPPTASLIYYL